MKSKKNIVLIGMMGSGKSSIGKLLSEEMNLEFIDIDRKIEMIENNTISDIFKKKGESYFREIEKKISIDNLKLENKIISLGGGGFINNSIRKQCSKSCSTIWLNWKMETLMQRINKSKKRPLAMKLNSFEMKKLMNERAKIYNLSDYKINCDKLNKKQIIRKIVKIYENK